jgi:N-dimethylarginine dimethylaminohydrolase
VSYLKTREVLAHRPGSEINLIHKPERWFFTSYPNLIAMNREHEEIIKILEKEGVRVHNFLTSMTSKPKLYITMDNAVVIDKKAITGHFITGIRRGEEQIVKKVLKELGIGILGHIFPPGFLHGSDLFFTDKKHAFAIVGPRTNEEGIKHLVDLMKIDVTPIFMDNLSSLQFNIINDVAVISEEIVYEQVYKVLKENKFDIVLASKKDADGMGLNFLQIDDNKIVNVKADVNKKLRMIGFDVIEVEIRELMKGETGIRNMFLPFY